jgi:hypothetical protein
VHKQRSFKQQNNDNAAMGNNFGSSGSNTVALADNAGNPYCRGSPGCISTTFAANPMDPRLAAFMTQEEYLQMLSNVDREANKVTKGCSIRSGVPLLLAVVLSLLFTKIFVKGANQQCIAPNGACEIGMNPEVDGCCNYWCCDANSNAENQYAADIRADQSSSSPGFMGCYGLPPFSDLACLCVCSTTGAPAGERGSSTTCDCGDTQIEGLHEYNAAEGAWAQGIAGILMFVGIAWAVGYGIIYIGLIGVKKAVLDTVAPWHAKGIHASFCRGGKHRPNYLVLKLPQGGAMMQVVQVPMAPVVVAQGQIAVPMATPIGASIQEVVPAQPQTEQMQLVVPQGSGPGSVINVQAPSGRQVQVAVPAGYMPGMPMIVQI